MDSRGVAQWWSPDTSGLTGGLQVRVLSLEPFWIAESSRKMEHRCARSGFKLNRQTARAMHMQCFARFPRLIVRPPKAFEASEQIGERDARFHPREWGADTEMQTVPKGHVRIGIARDIE